MTRLIIPALVALLISGCQTTYSISKTAELTPLREPFTINFRKNYSSVCEIGNGLTHKVSVRNVDGVKSFVTEIKNIENSIVIIIVSSINEDGSVEVGKITKLSPPLDSMPSDYRRIFSTLLKYLLHERLFGGTKAKQGGHLYVQPSLAFFEGLFSEAFPNVKITNYSDKVLIKGIDKLNNEYFIVAGGLIQFTGTLGSKEMHVKEVINIYVHKNSGFVKYYTNNFKMELKGMAPTTFNTQLECAISERSP